MPQLKALIFDLDGTLMDSAPDLRQAINLTLQDAGRKPLPLDEIKSLTGDGMLPMLSRAFAATGPSITEKEAYNHFQVFINHYRTLKPDPSQFYPHTVETLQWYRDHDIKIGLCTNKQETATHRLLKDLDIHSYFAFIAGGDTFPVHKPHPGHVLGVIEKLKISANSCVMIGDSTNDIRAAQAAGIPCIAVTHGYGEDVGGLGADAVISHFKDLPAALETLGFQIL